MSITFEIQAATRQEFGKGASRRLRRLGNLVPAIIYGGGEPALALSVDHNQLSKALEHEAFYSHILTIHVDGKPQKAVLKALQRHPYKPRILHMDLLRITGKEKINMHIPLHFKGDDVAPGVKDAGGIASHLLSTIEVRCMPADLPEYIEVDLSNLGLDEAIHLSQLNVPKGVELVALAHGNDQAVASIHIPRATIEEEEEAAAAAAAEAEAAAATEAGAEAGATPEADADKDKAKG